MTSRLALLAALLALAACTDAAPSPTEEVAAELRALRLQLAAAAQPPATTTPAPAAAEVLAPLRTVLDGLVSNQSELAARQLALTQELQRWSQLLVETVTGKHGDEAKAMAQKLAQFEEALKQQDNRHREVEALMQGALERTADRLDDFLRRLHGVDNKPAGTAPGTTAPGGGTNTEPPKQANGNDGKRPLGARTGTTRWWWLGLTGASCLVAAFFLRRAFRVRQPPHALARVEPPREQTAEELWAAAALLGEAVDRLRQSKTGTGGNAVTAPGGGEPVPATAGHEADPDMDEFVVIDDDDPIDDAAAAVHSLPPATVDALRAGPERLHCTLPAHAGAAAALAFLAGEPRVLRRPAPVVAPGAGGLQVEFAVLPGLSAGERAHLLLGLRAAAARR